MSMLEVRGLGIDVRDEEGGWARAVEDVSFAVGAGGAVGLVGESGSGKTLTLRAITGLLPPGTRHGEGEVILDGTRIDGFGERKMAGLRGRKVGMIFQDASTALDPLMRVGEQIAEVARAHLGTSRRAARPLAVDWLGRVGILDPELCARSYPHELSGGMRQRVAIAAALVSEPELLLCDEPTTALDVTVQAQVLKLIADLAGRTGAALLFVTHDLPVAAEMTAEVQVMYAGRIVEAGATEAVFAAPAHPYTQGLLAAVPTLRGPATIPEGIAGSPPAPGAAPPGCRFEPRCPRAEADCLIGAFPLHPVGPRHAGACIHDGAGGAR